MLLCRCTTIVMNVLSPTQQYLCSKFYVQFVIIVHYLSTVKSRQISNIHTHRFLLKCKNHLILPTDKSKSRKNNKSIVLELFT